MPFISQKSRDQITKHGIGACEEVGDICYVFYKHIVSAWKLEPRWRTIHRLYRDLIKDRKTDAFYKMVCQELYYSAADPINLKFGLDDIDTALILAWTEFYRNHAAKYEDEKRDINGDIL